MVSSIRNYTINITANNMGKNAEEIICKSLSEKTYNNNSPADLGEIIDKHLKILITNEEKISFLEQAFSSCDIIQPFGERPENITQTLEQIKAKITKLNPKYFFDLTNALKNGSNDEYQSISDKASKIILLSTGTKYSIQTTSGVKNNCLIYAMSKGTLSDINRSIIFSKDKIESQLTEMHRNMNVKSEHETDFNSFKQSIIGIYNEAGAQLQDTNNISEIATELSKYLINSNCFLDGQLAASIVAKHLSCNVVILTKDKKNPSGFSYKFIESNGNLKHNGELNDANLNNLKDLQQQDDIVFIYNHDGTHFEWLQKLSENS